MTPDDANSIIRGKGLCGYLVHGTHVCILKIGHDDKIHEEDRYLTKLDDRELAAIGYVLERFKQSCDEPEWSALMKLLTHYQHGYKRDVTLRLALDEALREWSRASESPADVPRIKELRKLVDTNEGQ